jgi:hypothetical protein
LKCCNFFRGHFSYSDLTSYCICDDFKSHYFTP